MALSKLKLKQLRDVCQEEDIDHSGLRRKKDLIERINEVREARQTAVEDNDGVDDVELTRTWLVLLASLSLKMAALIVVERSPQTSSGCDYS